MFSVNRIPYSHMPLARRVYMIRAVIYSGAASSIVGQPLLDVYPSQHYRERNFSHDEPITVSQAPGFGLKSARLNAPVGEPLAT